MEAKTGRQAGRQIGRQAGWQEGSSRAHYSKPLSTRPHAVGSIRVRHGALRGSEMSRGMCASIAAVTLRPAVSALQEFHIG